MTGPQEASPPTRSAIYLPSHFLAPHGHSSPWLRPRPRKRRPPRAVSLLGGQPPCSGKPGASSPLPLPRQLPNGPGVPWGSRWGAGGGLGTDRFQTAWPSSRGRPTRPAGPISHSLPLPSACTPASCPPSCAASLVARRRGEGWAGQEGEGRKVPPVASAAGAGAWAGRRPAVPPASRRARLPACCSCSRPARRLLSHPAVCAT